MNNQIRLMFLSAALAVLTLPAMAQSSAPPASSPSSPTTSPNAGASADKDKLTVTQRDEKQQDRISQGIDKGQLSAGEASNLEKKESELNQEQRDMRKMDNGHLTAADRATLNQQQNQLSKQITKDRHNAADQRANPTSEVGKHAENQQDRIANGVRSGQLTTGEAARLENREAKINQEVRADRAANGGQLTAAERAKVNNQQKRLSGSIHKDKHNSKHQ